MEVRPATVVVYNNQWTGKTGAFLPGTHFMVPGVHKRLEEITLRNEAKNPSNVMLYTGDGIELEIDYIIRRQQIGSPTAECAIQAATAINYKERDDKIQTRIVALLQQELEKIRFNDLFLGADLAAGDAGTKNNQLKQDIEAEVNKFLARDIVTTEWGFVIQIDLEDYNLPEQLRKAREQKVSATMEGAALKEKLQALGAADDPELKKWLLLADAGADALGRAIASLSKGKK